VTSLAWITGAGGLIGSHIASSARQFAPGWQIQPLTRPILDLCDLTAVEKAFRAERPALIIHCAALTSSAVCEAEQDRARQVNVEVTQHLAQLAKDIPFVFFSTDLVFDGRVGNYREDATPNPLSVYARTKLEAEQVVLSNPRHLVIRTSLNAGSSPTGDRSLNEQLRVAWERGVKTRLFTDEFRCPIPAAGTARAVWELVHQQRTGLYHLAGAQKLSRWEIGTLLARKYAHLRPQLEPGSLQDYSGPPRSPDTSLKCEKIQSVLSFRLPGFAEWIAM
jgi:dTDP-4-dehydrorhamnose reductase